MPRTFPKIAVYAGPAIAKASTEIRTIRIELMKTLPPKLATPTPVRACREVDGSSFHRLKNSVWRLAGEAFRRRIGRSSVSGRPDKEIAAVRADRGWKQKIGHRLRQTEKHVRV